METRTHFEISWQSLWRIFIFAALITILYYARGAVGALLVAIVVSLGLDPVVSFLEERKINRLLGTIFVFLFGLIVLTAAFYFIIPVLILEAGAFIGDFNRIISSIFGFGLPEGVIKTLGLNLDRALSFLTAPNFSLAGAISTLVEKLIMVLATIIISFYLSIEKDGTDKLLKVILPAVYEKPILTIFNRFKLKIRRWFAAQLALSLIVGVLVSFGLWILGVKYALVLGVLAALFEIVPIIGPVLAGAITFLVAVSTSFSLGMYALLFSFIVQQIENHVLIPIIMGRAMKIHPVIVIISLLAGGEVAGFLGIVLSVPIAVVLQEALNYLVERKSHRAPLGI